MALARDRSRGIGKNSLGSKPIWQYALELADCPLGIVPEMQSRT